MRQAGTLEIQVIDLAFDLAHRPVALYALNFVEVALARVGYGEQLLKMRV